MNRNKLIEAIIDSRKSLIEKDSIFQRKAETEGGCGVIGIAASVPICGQHLLQALKQMRNRGNGKGGGIAAVGLNPEFFGLQPEVIRNDYLLAIAYLDSSIRPRLESDFIEPTFIVDYNFQIKSLQNLQSIPDLEITPPEVVCYFVRVRNDVRSTFLKEHQISDEHSQSVDDEIVYQNSYRLNRAFYASTGDKQAFVLSHGKNMLVLKMVGYGDDVISYYNLENFSAHVWIGHHRYPTKGKVWHPGGAHPFIGMQEALVHNGDFANYASICTYLAQRNIQPQFLTDTEVAVLVFDLLYRIYGYPLEYVIEAMAPTTERDYSMLPQEKQKIYRMLQLTHMHCSPDGPWFFLIAQSDIRNQGYRLIGITDTSMLRPQVFALQKGVETLGFAASEKQGIDAALESLSRENLPFWSKADLYWNARGGSHTDGGAFIFTVRPDEKTKSIFMCTDKFGRSIEPDLSKESITKCNDINLHSSSREVASELLNQRELSSWNLFNQLSKYFPGWNYKDVVTFFEILQRKANNDHDLSHAIKLITLLMDRRYPTGIMKRSCLLSIYEENFTKLIDSIRHISSHNYKWMGFESSLPEPKDGEETLIIDARSYPSEGNHSLARAIVTMFKRGFRRFIITNTRGQRFIACGLGAESHGVHIDIYGSPGDYLASGIDGAEIIVHGTAQDQLAQIMKEGKLIVHGDVGQTFMYAAKGGRIFIMRNAAGRPLINAVGRPWVVINGTCLDYLAESFMAGDPLNGGGFVILNGISFDEDGNICELDTPYPGGNLFSLASGGAIYIRDPHRKITEDQLNGGDFTSLGSRDWAIIKPFLEENERLFGISLERLLTIDGQKLSPESVYRKIIPAGHKALEPEEAWVKKS